MVSVVCMGGGEVLRSQKGEGGMLEAVLNLVMPSPALFAHCVGLLTAGGQSHCQSTNLGCACVHKEAKTHVYLLDQTILQPESSFLVDCPQQSRSHQWRCSIDAALPAGERSRLKFRYHDHQMQLRPLPCSYRPKLCSSSSMALLSDQ